MITWAGMAKPSQSGPQRGNACPWAENILKTRYFQILMIQWQASAPKECILARWNTEDPRHELREILLQPLSEFIIFLDTISTFTVSSRIPSYFSLYSNAVPFSSSCVHRKVFSLQSLRVLSSVPSHFSSFFGWFFHCLKLGNNTTESRRYVCWLPYPAIFLQYLWA